MHCRQYWPKFSNGYSFSSHKNKFCHKIANTAIIYIYLKRRPLLSLTLPAAPGPDSTATIVTSDVPREETSFVVPERPVWLLERKA